MPQLVLTGGGDSDFVFERRRGFDRRRIGRQRDDFQVGRDMDRIDQHVLIALRHFLDVFELIARGDFFLQREFPRIFLNVFYCRCHVVLASLLVE